MTKSSNQLAVIVLLLSATPMILTLLGIDFGSTTLTTGATVVQQTNQVELLFQLLSGAFHHALLEWSAVSVAMIASLVSFVHYAVKRDISVPIVGCAVLCAGFMDAFHTMAATRIIEANAPNTSFIPFTWALSRSFHAGIMIIGVGINIWIYQQSRTSNIQKQSYCGLSPSLLLLAVVGLFIIISYATIHIAALSEHLPITIYPDASITRPFDILPLGLFILAGALFWVWLKQQKSVLKLALLLSITPEIASQLHMAFGSSALFDHHFNIAHLLKLFAYSCILIGLIFDLSNYSFAKQPHSLASTAASELDTQPQSQQTHKKALEVGIAKRPLGLQLPITAFVLAVSVSTVVSFSFYFESQQLILKQETEDMRIKSKLVEPLLAQIYRQSSSDVLFVSRTPEVQGFIDADHDLPSRLVWQNRLEQVFSQMLSNKHDYHKISFFSVKDNGQEFASAMIGEMGVEVLDSDQRRLSDNQRQINNIRELPWGGIYFSAIQLHRQGGKVVEPYQPIFKVLTPVYDLQTDEVYGAIAIEIKFSGVIKLLTMTDISELNMLLANQHGDVIYHPKTEYTFGFELGKRYLLQDLFPGIRGLISTNTKTGSFAQLQGIEGEQQAAFYRVIDLTEYGSDKPLILLLLSNKQQTTAQLQTYRYRSILIGISLSLVALALAVLAARRVVRPLTEMTIGVQEYEQTGKVPKLPINSSDELGVLARSFHNLLFRINNALDAQQQMATITQESSDKLEAILSSAADAIVTIDETGQILTFNTAAELIFGYHEIDMLGQNVSVLMPTEFAKNHFETITRYLQAGNSGIAGAGRELQGLHAKGYTFPIHLAISEVPTSQGKIFTGIIRDISVQKRNEEEKNHSLSLLKSILESTDNGILVTDEHGHSLHHNSRFAQMWCISDELVDSSDPEQLREHMTEQLKNPQSFTRDTQKLYQDLSSESLDIIHFQDGRVLERSSRPMVVSHRSEGRVWSYRDITTSKQTELALIEAKETAENIARYKSQFLASMSHEIRTPMNGVLGMLGLLQHSKLNESQRHHADLARSSAESLLTVINDILDFSKIEAGKLPLELIEYNLTSQLGEMVESIAHRAQEKDLELVLDVTEIKHTMVKGDPGRLRQILNNLISNAIKFTSHGEIKITASLTELDEQKLRFNCAVKDTGIGIEQDKLGALFESFTQVDASTTREYGGTGLGLAIVKQLCQLMDGDIQVSSEPGIGSCFEFSIIVESSEQSSPLLPRVDIQGLSMLVVDDNATNRTALKDQLELWGAVVTVAKSGQQALDILDQQNGSSPFSIAFIDMQMAQMNGMELGQRIREQQRFDDIHMVIMTSMSDRGYSKKFANLGFSGYFPKPTTIADIFDALAIITADDATLIQAQTSKVSHSGKALQQQARQTAQPMAFDPNTRLLLVEDNFINQAVALAQLQKLGLNCDVAANGLEALDTLNLSPDNAPYHLIFMDCQMPELDGYQTTGQIRAGNGGARYQNIPIIAMTANAMAGDKEKCLDSGMNDYISKPIVPEIVESKLRQWLLGH